MSREASEAALLDSVLPDLEAEGFEVFAHPSPPLLPAFMRDHSPDAIALREDKKLAIEVLHEGAPSHRRLDRLRELLSQRKDWELRVYWISPTNIRKAIEGVSRDIIEQSIKAAEELTADGRTRPALLMAWATFEAIGRAILPDKLQRPQPPGRLAEVLAADGYITPTEADHLRRLAESRNHVAHGGLETSVSEADLQRFVDVLKTLCRFISQ
jgi:uncharacterized protein YutE (UPF0331/DUF86 family)